MSYTSQRTIETILNLSTLKVEDAEDFFSSKTEADIFRHRTQIEKQIQLGTVEMVCVYCKQPVAIRGLKREDGSSHYFFTHPYKSDDCPIKTTSGLTPEQVTAMKYNGAKESEEHYNLKNAIAAHLERDPDVTSVAVDKVFKNVAVSPKWRKPDVLATYKDMQIAFELQLSTTFISVIVGRSIFYNEQKVFLLWVFNNFSVNDLYQRFTERDIFYNNRFNVFVFDKKANEKSEKKGKLILKCLYKEHSIQDKQLKSEWRMAYAGLDQIIFDPVTHQCYFKDTEPQYQEIKKQLLSFRQQEAAASEEAEAVARRAQIAERNDRYQRQLEEEVQPYLDYVRNSYRNSDNLRDGFERLKELDLSGRALLNEKLGFTGRNRAFIMEHFFDPDKKEFIRALCETNVIEIFVNGSYFHGRTAWQYLITIEGYHNFNEYLQWLTVKDYKVTEQDLIATRQLLEKNLVPGNDEEHEYRRRWGMLMLFSRLKAKRDAKTVNRHSNILLALLSIETGHVVGAKFTNLISVVHNALEHRTDHAELVLRALEKYDRLDILLQNDSNGKLGRRMSALKSVMPEQDHSIRQLVNQLFPSLI